MKTQQVNTISKVMCQLENCFVRFNKKEIIFERIKKGGMGGHRKPLYTNFKPNLIFS